MFTFVGEELEVLRTGCFKYFELGGECIQGPVSLLSGFVPFIQLFNPSPSPPPFRRIKQSPLLLAAHFFAVAFYAIWVMFTHPHPTYSPSSKKPTYVTPTIDQYPSLLLKSIRVVRPSFSLPPTTATNILPCSVLHSMYRLRASFVVGD
jgi:squalene monooxygenase